MNAALLALVFGSSSQLMVETITQNTTWTAPVGASSITKASGFGARGTNAYTSTTQQYTQVTKLYKHKKTGGYDIETIGTSTGIPGAKPANYCDASYAVTDPVYDNYSNCYEFTDTSFDVYHPATTGAATTAFGNTFPGSTGNVVQTPVEFNNITITPGGQYNLVVPSGGSLTLTYYK